MQILTFSRWLLSWLIGGKGKMSYHPRVALAYLSRLSSKYSGFFVYLQVLYFDTNCHFVTRHLRVARMTIRIAAIRQAGEMFLE